MGTAGLRGAAFERDPQIGTAVVVAQEPPAGELIPSGGVVGFGPCVARFGALDGEDPGTWTVSIVKHSSPPAAIQVTVTFAPR